MNNSEPKGPDPLIDGFLGLLALLLWGSIVADRRARERVKQIQAPQPQCPGCGHTPLDIAKSGRFGCPQCYEFYQQSIQPILLRCHAGATQHVGKRPKSGAQANSRPEEAAADIQFQIKNLEAKMANAVKVENYEIAGVLKVKIEELRQRLTPCET